MWRGSIACLIRNHKHSTVSAHQHYLSCLPPRALCSVVRFFFCFSLAYLVICKGRGVTAETGPPGGPADGHADGPVMRNQPHYVAVSKHSIETVRYVYSTYQHPLFQALMHYLTMYVCAALQRSLCGHPSGIHAGPLLLAELPYRQGLAQCKKSSEDPLYRVS